ncbi:MAG: ubiquinol oxidase subunit II [Janthinobacterium lividum]
MRSLTIFALLALTGCQPGVLDPVGPIASAERTLLIDSLLIMLAIIGPTILAILAFAWWFRSSNPHAKRLPDWAYSGQIELVTWGVPLLTITLLGGVAWVGSHELDPAKPLPIRAGEKPLEVQVVSLDWKWLFIYPEQGVASVNELAIRAGTPVHFQLTSASVMDSFYIPQLGSMIYTMNRMSSELNLQADQPGTYWGLSTHLSGDGFSDMHFGVRALDKAGFDAWIAAARSGGQALDTGRYAELAKQSIKDPVSTFSSVDPNLYQKIVTQELAPSPGPDPEPSPKTKPKSASNPTGGVLTASELSATHTHAMEH